MAAPPELTPDLLDFNPLDFLVPAPPATPPALFDPADVFDPASLVTPAGAQFPVIGPAINWGNFVLNIFGGAADLGGKIRDVFKGVGEWIWQNVGGVGRFLFNAIGDAIVWLSQAAASVGQDVAAWVSASAEWVRARVQTMLGDIALWVSNAGVWVVNSVRIMLGDISLWVSEAGEWVWNQVRPALDALATTATDAAEWLRLRVRDLLGDVNNWTSEVGTWVWNQVRPALDALATTATDAAEWLWALVEPAITGAAIGIADAFQGAFNFFADRIIGPVADVVEAKLAIPGKLFRGEYGSLAELWDDIRDPPPLVIAGLVGALIVGMSLSQILSAFTVAAATPLVEKQLQEIRARVPTTLPTPAEMMAGWNRGIVGESTVGGWLAAQGYGGEPERLLKELRHPLPSPTDLVRFGVREVFTPDIAERFGQFQDFPPAFGEEMAKHGFSVQDARNYWAAHWDLPSATQGFEMLHRGVIDEAELRLLLRSLDVMPYWRDRLTAISYNPFTRVDVRRMHKLGILNDDQVLRAYMDIGYEREKAAALLEFTKRFNAPEDRSEIDDRRDAMANVIRQAYRKRLIDRTDAVEKMVTAGFAADDAEFWLAVDDLFLQLNPSAEQDPDVREVTLTIIRDAYRVGIWDRGRAQAELEDLGFVPASADLILSIEDTKRENELLDLDLAVIREEYRNAVIDRDEARRRLEELELEPARLRLLLLRWDRENAAPTRTLTPAQVANAWERALFTDEQAMDRLVAYGYSPEDAGVVLQLTLPASAEARSRELSAGTIIRLYFDGALLQDAARRRLVAQGFSEEDADLLLSVQDRDLTTAQLLKAFDRDVLTRDQAKARLLALDYSDADAEILLATVEAVV
jgi:hypothetical protein